MVGESWSEVIHLMMDFPLARDVEVSEECWL